MDNSVIELIENLLVSNATLRQLADAGEWDAFFDESVAYTMGMRTLCDIDLTQLAQHNKGQRPAVHHAGERCASDARDPGTSGLDQQRTLRHA